MTETLTNSQLGKLSRYHDQYCSDLLFPVARELKRKEINVPSPLPFYGYDLWNAFELSWLNLHGKPLVAIAQFVFPCTSPHLIESKSLKLYLNSFNNTRFTDVYQVQKTITEDLSKAAGAPVNVTIEMLSSITPTTLTCFDGTCIDQLDVEIEKYKVDPSLIRIEDEIVTETLYSDLLKSNCLVTSQPDWGSIQIQYTGKKITHESLLKYIISYRNHNEFHEQCVEHIFMDITRQVKPQSLTVMARYTRRGGLDINPCRSSDTNPRVLNSRLYRQ